MRFCMFCGEQIPDQAVFCHSCGAKQPELEKKTEEAPVVEEQEDDSDNIALNLLSKANFASNKGAGKSIIPQYEPSKPQKKAVKVEADGNVVMPKKETIPEPVSEPEPEEKADDTPKISIKKQDTPAPELNIAIAYQKEEQYDDEEARMIAKMMEMMDKSSEPYTPPILESITEEIRQQKIEENYESLTGNDNNKEQSETPAEIPAELQAKPDNSTPTTVPADKSDKKPRRQRTDKPSPTKRNVSEDDETDDDPKYKMQKSSTISAEYGLTADEIADREKYRKYKESGEDKKDSDLKKNTPSEGRVKKGEGRKSSGRKKEIRRNIDKEIAERDIRDIEHEEVDKKNDIDKNYDGYYENVKPIDFDKMKDNTAVVKTAFTGIAVVILVSIVFYFIITFFMQ